VLRTAGDGRVIERHYRLHEPIESAVLPGFAPTPSELTAQL
jgi:hypothetical protein